MSDHTAPGAHADHTADISGSDGIGMASAPASAKPTRSSSVCVSRTDAKADGRGSAATSSVITSSVATNSVRKVCASSASLTRADMTTSNQAATTVRPFAFNLRRGKTHKQANTAHNTASIPI